MSIEINDDNFLDKLLEIVNTITYVENVYVDNDIYYANYGSSLPSDDEISDVNAILDNWANNQNRFKMIDSAVADMRSNLDTGYTVPSTLLSGDSGGWGLDMNTENLAVLSMQYLLAENNNSNNVTIIDNAGLTHTISISDMKLLMTSYNNAIVTIRTNCANTIANVNTTYNSYSGGGAYSFFIP